MKPLPLPVRVAAGLAAMAVEHVRRLPEHVVGLPVTAAGQAMRLSMRVRQQVTDLAVKGDDVLSALRPMEDHPDWATFDEDITEPDPVPPPRHTEPEPTPQRPPACLPAYPTLSLAQVRGRLRHLSIDDLRELLAYEQATNRRPGFERMLSNRIRTITDES